MKRGVTGVMVAGLVGALLASQAVAAPQPLSMDVSNDALIDGATSARIWRENVPARVAKLYPSGKFRFASDVTGGFSGDKTCVVSARVMLLPVILLPIQGHKVVYAPVKSATAFDAGANLTQAQCQDLARTKLKEAIQSLTAALAAG